MQENAPHQNAPHIPAPVSPLVLADRLLTLAQDASRAGFQEPAARLLKLAYSVYDTPRTAH